MGHSSTSFTAVCYSAVWIQTYVTDQMLKDQVLIV